jgi:hypothetical protein
MIKNNWRTTMRTQEIKNRISVLANLDTDQASLEDLQEAYYTQAERDFDEMSDEEINQLFDELWDEAS